MPFLPRGGARQAGGDGACSPTSARVDPGPKEVIAPFRALAEPLAYMVPADALPGALRGPRAGKHPFRAPRHQLLRGPARAGGGPEGDLRAPARVGTAPMAACPVAGARGAPRRRSPTTPPHSPIATQGSFVNVAAMYVDARSRTGQPMKPGLERHGRRRMGREGGGGYVGFFGEEDEATNPRCLSGSDRDRLPRAEAPLRPGQPLPPQPQHPAGGGPISRRG